MLNPPDYYPSLSVAAIIKMAPTVPKIALNNGDEIPAVGLGVCTYL
jgi:hypothetical protein